MNMGAPIFEPALIPTTLEATRKIEADGSDLAAPLHEGYENPVPDKVPVVLDAPLTVDGKEYRVSCVSMGNPHAIVYVDDVKNLPIEKIGPSFEKHERFPNRVNTEFVKVLDRNTVEMRVWERGSGETLACGTGACATAVACILNGLTEEKVTVKLLGGDLEIEWDREKNKVFMTGPANLRPLRPERSALPS